MDKLIERLYSTRTILIALLGGISLAGWYFLPCELKATLFWPVFAFFFGLLFCVNKLKRYYSAYPTKHNSQTVIYTVLYLAAITAFLTVFYSIWLRMGCNEILMAGFAGITGFVIAMYQSLSGYRELIDESGKTSGSGGLNKN